MRIIDKITMAKLEQDLGKISTRAAEIEHNENSGNLRELKRLTDLIRVYEKKVTRIKQEDYELRKYRFLKKSKRTKDILINKIDSINEARLERLRGVIRNERF